MADILPIVMDTSYNRIGCIDDYISLIWTTRYYEHGDFQIQVPITQDNVTMLALGNYILRDDDDNVGIIEKLDLIYSETNERILTVSGRFLTAILSRRIVAEQTVVTGSISSCINTLITDAIVNPAIIARKISNFVIGSYTISTNIEAQYTGKNLYEIISELALQYGFGFKITLNDNNEFVFKCYQGEDRSYNQSVNPYVIFSDEYDNLINSDYQMDASGMITDVLAAGEGEGSERRTVWVTNEDAPTGINRYEYYDDSRNTSSNEGEISDQEYLEQLAEDGRMDLTKYTVTFAGEADSSNVKFGVDVNVGDIVTIANSYLGLSSTVRIIELIESIEPSGAYSIIPTFGE